jgi:hypothetical protein
VALDALGAEHAMHPEPIEPDLLNDYDRDRSPHGLFSFSTQMTEQRQQCRTVATNGRVLRHLAAAWRQ